MRRQKVHPIRLKQIGSAVIVENVEAKEVYYRKGNRLKKGTALFVHAPDDPPAPFAVEVKNNNRCVIL